MTIVKQATQTTIVSPDTERWVLVSTIIASSMAAISASALNVALPALQADLGVSGTELLWIVNANALLLAALIMVGGSLGDHYGRKRMFTIGIVLFTVASVLCGFAPNSQILIASRALQGVGAALLTPASLALLTASFPAKRRGAAIGLWSTFSAMMIAIGPILGGWLASQGLWRWVFFINVPLSILTIIALTRVPESKDEHAPDKLDVTGSLLATLGLAGLAFGFIQAPDFGFFDWRTIMALTLGVVLLVAFVIVEYRSDHPVIQLSLFKNRTFSGANLLTLFLYGALGAVFFFLPLNLIQVQGYPAQLVGLALLPIIILMTVMSRWAGGLVDRIGPRLPLILGPFIAGCGLFLFARPGVTAGADDYWTTFFPAIVVMGLGMGLTVAPLTTAVMGSAPADSAGTASGINNAVSRSAGVLAVAIFGALAIVTFNNNLVQRTIDLTLSAEAQNELQEEAKNLAGAVPPSKLEDEVVKSVTTAIQWSFVESFRLVVIIAAGLCWLGTALAFFTVERPSATKDKKPFRQLRVLFHDHGCPTCDHVHHQEST